VPLSLLTPDYVAGSAHAGVACGGANTFANRRTVAEISSGGASTRAPLWRLLESTAPRATQP
jgi:hypothetical protein